MNVYIHGMEMPKSCYVCPFCDYVRRRAATKNALTSARSSPVPDHGRLIDADALEKDIDKYIGGEESRSRFHYWVQVQRTVIHESEEAHT